VGNLRCSVATNKICFKVRVYINVPDYPYDRGQKFYMLYKINFLRGKNKRI
jgi:hypothetical protein